VSLFINAVSSFTNVVCSFMFWPGLFIYFFKLYSFYLCKLWT
jgi:hypothetical protein